MSLKFFTAAWVIAAFLLSIHGKIEPELRAARSYEDGSVLTSVEDRQPVPTKGSPSGDHVDQHGCYHSHAPFTVVAALFNWNVSVSFLTTSLFSPPLLISSIKILHPPRA